METQTPWFITTPGKQRILLLIIFLLTLTDMLQSGMMAFAAGPLMGETGTSPEQYSFITASYACVAILMISKQRWIVERTGWRLYIAVSLMIFAAGAFMCSRSSTYHSLLTGRIVMAAGGASFLTGARVMVNLIPPGPRRFSGIKAFASGLAAGTALAPFLAAWSVEDARWTGIFLILILLAAVVFMLSVSCLPDETPPERLKSQSHPFLLMALAAGAFAVLWVLQRSDYRFFSDLVVLGLILLLGITALYYFLSSVVRFHGVPLLMVRELFSRPSYILGVSLFSFCYIMIGLNNYFLPQLLRAGLGYSWGTVGTWYGVGLSGVLIAWLIMGNILPKRPGAKKFFITGFILLALYGGIMGDLSPQANLVVNIVPAIGCYGAFIMLVMATTAMQTFREIQHNETVFSHANQIKNMAAQFATAIGLTVANIGMQWRTTAHYNVLNNRVETTNPLYQAAVHTVSQQYNQWLGADQASRAALVWVANQVKQQSVILASLDFGHAICITGLVLAIAMGCQKIMR